MNPIKNIEITNFKSIRHQKIEDCRRINVFIGYPNTGKSNLLEAIGMYSSLLVDDVFFKLNEICRLRRFSDLFFNADFRSSALIKINEQIWLELLIDEVNQLSVRGRLGKSQPNFFEAVVDGQNFQYRRTKFDQNTLKDLMAPVRKYDFRNNISINGSRPFALSVPYGGNLLEILHRDSEIRKEIVNLLESYDQKLLLSDDDLAFVKYLNDGTGVSMPRHLVADTLIRMIFFKAAVMSNSGSVLLFEEPEAHMFPPYISKFTSDIWYHKGNQYFLTTHSPFVINDFLENARNELAVYLVEYKKEVGETVVTRMTDDQVHEVYQFGMDIFFNLESITR